MQEIQGYSLIPLKISKHAKSSHTIFARENTTRVKDPMKPEGRTLFLLNIPPYVTEDHIKYGFQKIGEVVSVQFHSKPGKSDEPPEPIYDKFLSKSRPFIFKVAYVVFKSTKTIKAALKLESIDLFDDRTESFEDSSKHFITERGKIFKSKVELWMRDTLVKSGVQKWYEEHLASVENEDELQQEIDKYMATYDRKEQAAVEAEKSQTADDEGWVTVTKRGPNAGFEQKQSVVDKLEEKMERSRKKKELTNFYTFQIRESKMQNIVSLRKKFEEDKNRIETLKKARRFKPF